MSSKDWATKLDEELEKYYKVFVNGVVDIMDKHIPDTKSQGIQWRAAHSVTESAVVGLDCEAWWTLDRRRREAKEVDNAKD